MESTRSSRQRSRFSQPASIPLRCAETEEPLLESLLRSNPICAPVLAAAAKREVQILYTQIDRDADNRPHFTRHEYRVNPEEYFYPGQRDQAGGCPAGAGEAQSTGHCGTSASSVESRGPPYARPHRQRVQRADRGARRSNRTGWTAHDRPLHPQALRRQRQRRVQPALRVCGAAADERGAVGEGGTGMCA